MRLTIPQQVYSEILNRLQDANQNRGSSGALYAKLKNGRRIEVTGSNMYELRRHCSEIIYLAYKDHFGEDPVLNSQAQSAQQLLIRIQRIAHKMGIRKEKPQTMAQINKLRREQ